jgi:simple sugar transport system permease protein
MVEFIKKNLIGLIASLLLVLLIFVLPGVFEDSESLLMIDRTLILVTGLAYIVYKALQFRKDNPNFKPGESTTLVNVAGSIIAIIIGLLFGLVLMIIVSPSQAIPGFFTILKGGFDNLKSMGNMVYFSVPIILTGLSVAFAFRTGLFNIGATGQLTMGAFTAVFIGVQWGFLGDIHPLLHWGVAVLGAMIAGGIWGSIPGLLKAYRNVNEVVASIMLNYVAMYLNTMLIKQFIYNSDYARALDIETSAVTPTANLEILFPRSSIDAGIIVAVIVVIILHILLNKTTFGFELKAVGLNRNSARYAGMNSKRNIVYSMIISGMVSGLAGAMLFLVQGKHLKPINELLPQGFTGIAISLLGLSSPFGVLLAGTFYGSLQQGGYLLQLYDFKPEIIDIIIAVIIYASALALFLQKFVIRALKSKEMALDATEQILVNEGGDE